MGMKPRRKRTRDLPNGRPLCAQLTLGIEEADLIYEVIEATKVELRHEHDETCCAFNSLRHETTMASLDAVQEAICHAFRPGRLDYHRYHKVEVPGRMECGLMPEAFADNDLDGYDGSTDQWDLVTCAACLEKEPKEDDDGNET